VTYTVQTFNSDIQGPTVEFNPATQLTDMGQIFNSGTQ